MLVMAGDVWAAVEYAQSKIAPSPIHRSTCGLVGRSYPYIPR